MKTIVLGSLLVLSVIIVGVVVMTSNVSVDNPETPIKTVDNPEITIETVAGSGVSGCESTAEGCYIPNTATINVGGKVIFSNTDSVAHTFTSGVTSMNVVGTIFDSDLAPAGSTYEWSPTETGEFPYFCVVHPWMTGMIIVED